VRLSKFYPYTKLDQHKGTFVPRGNSVPYRNSFTHLRFTPSAFREGGYKKHPFEQSFRAFCRKEQSKALSIISSEAPEMKKACDKFSAKKKFVSLKEFMFSFLRGQLYNDIAFCLNPSKLQKEIQCSKCSN
jgi:hypothetical protein